MIVLIPKIPLTIEQVEEKRREHREKYEDLQRWHHTMRCASLISRLWLAHLCGRWWRIVRWVA